MPLQPSLILQSYNTVQDAYSSRPQRDILNFVGAVATDNPSNKSTDIVITNAGTVTSVATTSRLSGGPITTAGTLDLATSGVTAASYSFGNGTITIDAYGRSTSAASATNLVLTSRNINTTSGQLTGGGSLSADRTLGLATSGVTAATYSFGNGSLIFDSYGRATSATSATNIPIINGLVANRVVYTTDGYSLTTSSAFAFNGTTFTLNPTGVVTIDGTGSSTIQLAPTCNSTLFIGNSALTINTTASSMSTVSSGTYGVTSTLALSLTAGSASTWNSFDGYIKASTLDRTTAGTLTIGGTATTAQLAAGVTLSGVAGAGALSLGSMTGNTTLPTGNISYTGASTKTVSLVTTGAGSTITITAGAASTWDSADGAIKAATLDRTTSGALTVGAATASSLGLGASGITTTVNGNVTLGSSSANTVSITANVSGNITLLKENAHTISIGNSSTAATAGGALSIISAAGSDSTGTNAAAGGAISITSGHGGASLTTDTAAVGGAFTISAGLGGANTGGTGTSGAGGALTMVGGQAGAANAGTGGAGGNVVIRAGLATGSATNGTVSIGVTNTSAISLGASGITTTITGGLTQQTGAFSLTGNATSQLTTSSGNTTVDAAAVLNLGTSTATTTALGRAAGITTILGGSTSSLNLSAGSGVFSTSTGTNTLNGTVSVASGKSVSSAGGAANLDWSSSSGTFDTSTGANTIRGNLAVPSSSSVTFDYSNSSGVFKTSTGTHTLGSATINVPANTIVTAASSSTNTSGLSIVSNVADGASSTGIVLNNTTALSTSAAGLLSLKNAGTEKLRIDYNGYIVSKSSATTFAVNTYTEVLGLIGFQNGWVNFGGTNATAGYLKDAFGFVVLKGTIKSGTINTAAFTLPTGFRPIAKVLYPSVGNNGTTDQISRIDIDTTGTVVPAFGGNTYQLLDGIRFLAGN